MVYLWFIYGLFFYYLLADLVLSSASLWNFFYGWLAFGSVNIFWFLFFGLRTGRVFGGIDGGISLEFEKRKTRFSLTFDKKRILLS